MAESIESTIEFIQNDMIAAVEQRFSEGLSKEFWEGYIRAAHDFSKMNEKLKNSPSTLAETYLALIYVANERKKQAIASEKDNA